MTASKELLMLIDQYVSQRQSAAQISEAIVKQAEKEEIPLDEVAELIKAAFEKRGLSERQARRAIPEEFKRTYWKNEKNSTSDMMSDVKDPISKSAGEAKIIHKDSSEINIPQPAPEIVDAESEPVPRQERLLMDKKILGKLYEIRGKYQGDYDFALIAENGRIIEVEPHPVLKAEALRA